MAAQPARWPKRAERLAGLIPPSALHPAATAAAAKGNRGPWVIALSGGADSLALLLLVWFHWPRRRSSLQAVHFNHRLRGRAADRDEEFCRRVCDGLGVKLSVGRRRAGQAPQGEAESRAWRFRHIERRMRRLGANTLWLGHQQNDVAETMLMRLARGSGGAGLAAPRPVQVMPAGRRHLRPLLDLKHEAIVAALRAAKVPWREDASNAGDAHFRNRIRHDVLPRWVQAAGRDAVAGAALSRTLLDEDDAALEVWARQLAARMPPRRLALKEFDEVPRAVVRRVLRRWLASQPQADGLSRIAFETLLDAVVRGEPFRHSLGPQGFAVIRRRELRFERG